jgi:hypothetical protein
MTLILLKASKVKRQMLNSESVSYYREQKAINPNFRGDDKLDDLEDKARRTSGKYEVDCGWVDRMSNDTSHPVLGLPPKSEPCKPAK